MHNSESERIRDMVLLWNMMFGKEWVNSLVVDTKAAKWAEIKRMADTLGEHKYLEYNAVHEVKIQARLNNKALKLIGAVEHDGETT